MDDPNLSDGELLTAFAQTRAQGPFAQLVRRHQDMVLAVCRRWTGNRHDAEDAAQRVFLLLVRKCGALQRRESLSGWLHTTAQHVSRTMHRAKGRRRQRETEASQGEGRESREIQQREMREALDGQLAQLPAKYREPIVLHHLQGLPQKQAARRMGLGESAFSVRLTRGRKMLADRLSRSGFMLTTAALVSLQAAPEASASFDQHPAFFQQALDELENSSTMLSRLKIAAVFLLLTTTVAGTTYALTTQDANKPGNTPVKTKAEAKNATRPVRSKTSKADQALRTPIARMNFNEGFSLPQTIAFLKELSGVAIVLDVPSIKKAGVDPEFEVRINAENLPLGKALNVMLSPKKLTYRVDGEKIVICSLEKAKETITTDVYPAANLLTDGTGKLENSKREHLQKTIELMFLKPERNKKLKITFSPTKGAFEITHHVVGHRDITEFLENLDTLPEATKAAKSNQQAWVGFKGDQLAEKALSTNIANINFSDGFSLPEVIMFLKALTKTSFTLDQPGLKKAGIDPGVEVTINAKNVPLAQALETMLTPKKLTYLVQNGMIVITTPATSANTVTIRIYPVAELVQAGTVSDREKKALALMKQLAKNKRAKHPENKKFKPAFTFLPSKNCIVIRHHAPGHRQIMRQLQEQRDLLTKTN